MNLSRIISLCAVLLVACGEPKKQDMAEKEKPAPVEPRSETESPATTLDELVYEAEGRSTIKSESAARSQAELKGRAGLLKELESDAGALISGFAENNATLFTSKVSSDAWSTALREHFNSESFTLKGSVASEFEASDKGDTTIATMSLPLMAGYEIIETALIDVATSRKWVQDENIDTFKKSLREYYLTEKKKLLTQPS